MLEKACYVKYYCHFVGHYGVFCGLKWRIWQAKRHWNFKTYKQALLSCLFLYNLENSSGEKDFVIFGQLRLLDFCRLMNWSCQNEDYLYISISCLYCVFWENKSHLTWKSSRNCSDYIAVIFSVFISQCLSKW